MNTFTNTEKKIATDLINAGFKKAAQSFASMVNQEVSIETTDIEILVDLWAVDKNYENDGEFSLLTTKVIGDLSGKSFLIFNKEESQLLYRTCFPQNKDKSNPELESALLMEIDNILSASVITEISNFLGVKIYGDVPMLVKSDMTKLKEIIKEEFAPSPASTHMAQGFFLVANTKFVFKNNLQVQPQFFWKFTEQFMYLIRKNQEI